MERHQPAKDSPRSGSVDRTKVYQLACEASDCAWRDATAMNELPLLKEVAAQLIRAVGSISATIAEGYARRSPRDRIRYYEYAMGSAEESRAWYGSGRKAISAADLDERIDRLTSIRRLLLTMIRNERAPNQWNSPRQTKE